MLEKTKMLMHFESNVNRDAMEERKVANTVSCSHPMLAEVLVFVDVHLHHSEPDSLHGGLYTGGDLFVRK